MNILPAGRMAFHHANVHFISTIQKDSKIQKSPPVTQKKQKSSEDSMMLAASSDAPAPAWRNVPFWDPAEILDGFAAALRT